MEKRLYRSKTSKIIGGVLGGLAEYFNIDPAILRIIFILAFFFIKHVTGLLILSYLTAWFVLPSKERVFSQDKEGGAKEIFPEPIHPTTQNILAWSLIIIGFLSLFFYIAPSSILLLLNRLVWPILLIGFGVFVLVITLNKK